MNRLKALSKDDLCHVINLLMLHNLNTKRDLDIVLRDLEYSKSMGLIAKEEKAFGKYLAARTAYANYALELSNARRPISDSEWVRLTDLGEATSKALAEYERLNRKVSRNIGVGSMLDAKKGGLDDAEA